MLSPDLEMRVLCALLALFCLLRLTGLRVSTGCDGQRRFGLNTVSGCFSPMRGNYTRCYEVSPGNRWTFLMSQDALAHFGDFKNLAFLRLAFFL